MRRLAEIRGRGLATVRAGWGAGRERELRVQCDPDVSEDRRQRRVFSVNACQVGIDRLAQAGIMVSEQDGHLTHTDAYDLPEKEDKIC